MNILVVRRNNFKIELVILKLNSERLQFTARIINSRLRCPVFVSLFIILSIPVSNLVNNL